MPLCTNKSTAKQESEAEKIAAMPSPSLTHQNKAKTVGTAFQRYFHDMLLCHLFASSKKQGRSSRGR